MVQAGKVTQTSGKCNPYCAGQKKKRSQRTQKKSELATGTRKKRGLSIVGRNKRRGHISVGGLGVGPKTPEGVRFHSQGEMGNFPVIFHVKKARRRERPGEEH